MQSFFRGLGRWSAGTFLTVALGFGADFYVSPTGSPYGTGSIQNPWDLATALDHPQAVRPGDTIWLRGGTYRGKFMSLLAGTAAAPIIVRRYQNERAILDGASPASPTVPMLSSLTVNGPYTWFWGFEITNSETRRTFLNSQCWENQHCRAAAVDVFGIGVKLINLVIHDTGNGIGLWTPAVGAEAYGNIIFYTGWQSEVRGSGHGLYAQNGSGTKKITNNIVFDGFHSGVHVYGSSESQLRNVDIDGNIFFKTGLLGADPNGWGIIVGGNVLADNIRITNNSIYNPDWYYRSANINPSYGSLGTTRLTLTGNTSIGYRSIEYGTIPTASTVTGNIFAGIMGDSARQSISTTLNQVAASNTFGPLVRLRQNQYEPNTTYVSIFNGALASSIAVNPSAVLQVGDTYRVRDVQNYFGAPLLTGTYTGAPIQFPMNNVTLASPVGAVPRAPAPSGPSFGAFILERTTGSGTPPTQPPPTQPPPTQPPPTQPPPTQPPPTQPPPTQPPPTQPPPTQPPPPINDPPTLTTCAVNAACQAEIGIVAAPMAAVSSTSAQGGRYLTSPTRAQGYVTLRFNLASAQTIGFWLRLAASSSSRDSIYVSVDGGAETLFSAGSGSSSFRWVRVSRSSADAEPLLRSLTAGQHTLRLRTSDANLHLDAVAVASSLSYTPR